MKHIAIYKLSALIKKGEKLMVCNVFSTFIFIVFPCIYVFFIDGKITLDLFWKYEIGLVVINSVTFLKLFQKGKTLNKIISAITIKDGKLIMETLPFRVMKFWTIKQKIKSINFPDLIFSRGIFPLKDKDYILDQSCLLTKINGETFYLLDSFFDDAIITLLETEEQAESEV
jgi:hypothetical protein